MTKMLKWQAYICPICTELLIHEEETDQLHVHHLIPKYKGGPDTYENYLT